MSPIHVRALTEGEFYKAYAEMADKIGDIRVRRAYEQRYLPKIVMEDELLLWAAHGYLKRTGKGEKKCGSLVALTDRRILMIGLLPFGTHQLISINLDAINSITADTDGIFHGGFSIRDSNETRQVGTVLKKSVHPFVQHVQQAIGARKLEARSSLADGLRSNEVDDMLSQLERLAALRERGILTDAEFAEQKQKILSAKVREDDESHKLSTT